MECKIEIQGEYFKEIILIILQLFILFNYLAEIPVEVRPFIIS